MTPLLGELMTQLTTARETADSASRGLAGEQVAAPMGMGGTPGADAGMPPGAPEAGGMPPEPAGDEFAATDAAAGGAEELGRELR